MKSVRIFYTKGGRMRFVSHLDMTRFMTRTVRRAGIPVWYTEGFHPHLYLTFALPLSLGFESTYEVMDLRLTDDGYPLERVAEALNGVFPPYVHVENVAEPVLKTGKIGYAEFDICLEDGGTLETPLREFLALPQILCRKTTKKGAEKELDLAPKLTAYEVKKVNGNTVLHLTLPAGGKENINPTLLLDVFFENQPTCAYRITRTAILDENKNLFR